MDAISFMNGNKYGVPMEDPLFSFDSFWNWPHTPFSADVLLPVVVVRSAWACVLCMCSHYCNIVCVCCVSSGCRVHISVIYLWFLRVCLTFAFIGQRRGEIVRCLEWVVDRKESMMSNVLPSAYTQKSGTLSLTDTSCSGIGQIARQLLS